jgi:aspartate racemase
VKTIGLMGGMSWESSIEYYRLINELTREQLGGFHSGKSVMVSLDFAEIEQLQARGRWDEAAAVMVRAGRDIQEGGADFLVICTNTMHKVADQVEAALDIPLLHIADATAGAIRSRGLTKAGLLGTKFTMEDDFYRGRLEAKHGLTVLLPDQEEREVVHRVIYDELVVGEINPESKARYHQVIEGLVARGAEGVILGCTEIGLLVKPGEVSCPVFDTMEIHAAAAVKRALSG